MEIDSGQIGPEDRLLTPEEVRDRLRVANQTLTNWRYRGTGPDWTKVSGQVGKPGGAIRYPESRLNAYLQGRTRSAVAA
jgi:hypothetical protein